MHCLSLFPVLPDLLVCYMARGKDERTDLGYDLKGEERYRQTMLTPSVLKGILEHREFWAAPGNEGSCFS